MAKEEGPRCMWVLYQTVNSRSQTEVFFPEKRDIGILYCHLLLHDTMLRDDSHRTGTADSPFCECGSKKNLLNIFYYVVSSGVLGGICGYTAYTNLRGFLTAYTHLSDHK